MGLEFNGAQRVQFGDVAAFLILGDLSWCGWVKFTNSSANADVIVSFGTSGESELTNIIFYLETQGADNARDIRYLHEHTGGSDQANTFDTNILNDVWTHLGVIRTVSTNDVDLYLDGVFFGNYSYTTDPTSVAATTKPYDLGAFNNDGNDFQDAIGGPLILANVAWTAGEMADAYAGKKQMRGIVHGSHIYSPTDLADFSGNGNNGTLVTGTPGLAGNPPLGQNQIFSKTRVWPGSATPAPLTVALRSTMLGAQLLTKKISANVDLRATQVGVALLTKRRATDNFLRVTQAGITIMTGTSTAEAEFDDIDDSSGGTIGINWVEFQANDDTWYVWSTSDLADPSDYFRGFKEARVLKWGEIKRALSGFRGQHEGMEFSWRQHDTDRLMRALIDDNDTRAIRSQPAILRSIGEPDWRIQKKPRVIARGLIEDYKFLKNREFEFRAVDEFSQTYNVNTDKRQIPLRRIVAADFPDAPEDSIEQPVPIIYGNLTDGSAATTVQAGPATVTVIGLQSPNAAPTGLSVTVVSSPAQLGVKDRPAAYAPVYHVTYFDAAGEESQLSDNFFSPLQSGANQTPRITWNAVGGATKYHIYRAIAYKNDFNQVNMVKLTGTTFDDIYVGRNERSPCCPGLVPHDHNFFFSSWRAGCRVRVYAKFADGTFSLGTEAYMTNSDKSISKGSNYFSGVHQHNDSGSTIGSTGNRRIRVTWGAVANAVEYHLWRGHGAYKWGEPFKDKVVVPHTQLTYDWTFTAHRNGHFLQAGEELPEEVSTTTEATGKVPCINAGTETISGDEWTVMLVCGHAVKQITAVFFEVDADEEDTEDENLETTRQFQKVETFGTGEDWLQPDGAGWPHVNRYITINSHRYTVIYSKQNPPPKTVQVNVLGIEDNGSGNGTLITDIFDQYKHFLENWVYNSYETGAWFPNPVFADDPAVPKLANSSFITAKLTAGRRLSGGYPGAWAVGSDGFKTVRDVLAILNVSADCDSGHNRKSQFMISMFEETVLPNAKEYTELDDIESGSFQMIDQIKDHANVVPYSYSRDYVLDKWGGNEEAADAESISDFNDERLLSFQVEMGATRNSAMAADVANRRLLRTKYPPRMVRGRIGRRGFDTELGDLTRWTHGDGIGALGFQRNPIRITRHSTNPNDFRVTLEGWDVEELFRGGFIFNDEGAPAAWTSATGDERRYGYLCDETSGEFSDGEPGKRLR